jgi:hypothetical protein
LQRQAGDNGPKITLAGETKRRVLERRLLEEAERNYHAHVAERAKSGAGATLGTRLTKALVGQTMRGRPISPNACSSRRGHPRQEQ